MSNNVTNKLQVEGDEQLVDALLTMIQTEVCEEEVYDNLGSLLITHPDYYEGTFNERNGSGTVLARKTEDSEVEVLVENVGRQWLYANGWAIRMCDRKPEFIDFRNIVPMPRIVRDSTKYSVSSDDRTKNAARNWYDWCIMNWGTKWNAYDTNVVGDAVIFDTAWSFPEPVILALSKLFPELTITCSYVDEGWNFAGVAAFWAGVMTHNTQIPCEKDNPEFCDICLELKGYMPGEDDEDE